MELDLPSKKKKKLRYWDIVFGLLGLLDTISIIFWIVYVIYDDWPLIDKSSEIVTGIFWTLVWPLIYTFVLAAYFLLTATLVWIVRFIWKKAGNRAT